MRAVIPLGRLITVRASQQLRVWRIYILWILLLAASLGSPSNNTFAYAAQDGYKKYIDLAGRFSFDYPASMRCNRVTADEVTFSHPSASLRIAVLVEPRQNKKILDPRTLLESLKKNLAEGSKDATILEQGRLPEIPGVQGYFVCTFKDEKGRKVMQLVQYYISLDKMFQMIISDRPQGFMNVEKVIRNVHRSLKILKPSLD